MQKRGRCQVPLVSKKQYRSPDAAEPGEGDNASGGETLAAEWLSNSLKAAPSSWESSTFGIGCVYTVRKSPPNDERSTDRVGTRESLGDHPSLSPKKCQRGDAPGIREELT